MATNVYSSADAGAPSLTVAVGSLMSMLQTLFSTAGYGSKAGLGWNTIFTGTNQAVFQQPAGSGFCFFLDDSIGPYANVVGYESMSSLTAGVNPFPAPSFAVANTHASGCYNVIKGAAGTSGNIPWIALGDSKTFYLLTYSHSSLAGRSGFTFGDFLSANPNGESFCCCIGGEFASNASDNSPRYEAFSGLSQFLNSGVGNPPLAIARNWLGGSGNSIVAKKLGDTAKTNIGVNGGVIGGSGMTFPAPVSGGLYIDDIRIVEETPVGSGNYIIRGQLRGVYAPAHPVPLGDLDTFSGAATGPLTGKTFVAVNLAQCGASLNIPGQIVFETTPWS